MADRIQLAQEVYMELDGQGQIVLGGSIIDVASAGKFAPQHITVVAETAGTVTAPVVAKSVRKVRTR